MNENNENENKIVYSIPGVIIPPQQTENGEVIENAVDNYKEEHKVVEEPIKEEAPVVVEEPVIQATEVAVPKEETPVVNNIQQKEVPIKPEPPVVNNIQQKEVPIKPEPPKKKFRLNTYTFIILILVLLLGFFIYDDLLNKKDTVDPVKELQKKRTLNKNSLVVQQLYDYINLDGCGEQIDFFYGNKGKVLLTDLTDENKNYLAFRMLKNSDFTSKNCSNYVNALNSNDPVKLWYCGDYVNTGNENTTISINSDVLEKQVNKMFGEASYKPVTFAVASSARYLYDEKTGTYLYQTFNGTNSCRGYENILDSVYRQKDNIVLKVKVKSNTTNNLFIYTYTFQESEDGNYYFVSLVKSKV